MKARVGLDFQPPIQSLVVKVISPGDPGRDSFAAEMMSHLDHLYRVAFHLVKNPDEAQDCVQEAYARALAARGQYSPGTHLKAWLTRILCNLCFDLYARNRRLVSADGLSANDDHGVDFWETQVATNAGPEALLLERELAVEISGAIQRIPEEFRAPIVLVDMGDLSYAEAAEALGCPLGTVRSRLSRGRKLLEKQLLRYMRPAVAER
jgi:RNA polymerase sigma-70 factor (ECF subfamily)